MKVFYPSTTEKIIHKGKGGNTYRLDGIELCISLHNALRSDPYYSVCDISTNKAGLDNLETLINTCHSPKIIQAIKSGMPTELANASGVMWQPDLYYYVLESALISKLVAEEALTNNSALAIVGGGHHAEYAQPFGFCIINTMAITAKSLTTLGKKVSILDLDVHFSNGCFDILQFNPNVCIYSLWNQALEKWKYFEPTNKMWHKKVTNSTDYFVKLQELTDSVMRNKPDALIYHLGLDILASDRMGGIQGITEKELMQRDQIIKDLVTKLAIPLVIFLGGAYVDWSKGESYAKTRHIHLTHLQCKLLDILCR